MEKKLIVDLAKCKLQAESQARCSYKHHPDNKGIDSLLERIRFALVCRNCEYAPCVSACPNDALEEIPSGIDDKKLIKRASMLCTGCGTCAIACPFGTIYDDLLSFFTSTCDQCKERLASNEKPLCVTTTTDGSLEYDEVDVDSDPDLVEVVEGVVVRVSGGVLWQPFLREDGEGKT